MICISMGGAVLHNFGVNHCSCLTNSAALKNPVIRNNITLLIIFYVLLFPSYPVFFVFSAMSNFILPFYVRFLKRSYFAYKKFSHLFLLRFKFRFVGLYIIASIHKYCNRSVILCRVAKIAALSNGQDEWFFSVVGKQVCLCLCGNNHDSFLHLLIFLYCYRKSGCCFSNKKTAYKFRLEDVSSFYFYLSLFLFAAVVFQR